MTKLRTWQCACLALVLMLVGCSEHELYSRLSEQEANDMVALLYAAGMPATKKRNSDDSFVVLTSQEAFANAVSLLHANGFPRQNYDTLGKVFAKEGFVSSPLEERARLNHALSQEIAHTISSIDGVVMARVHLAVPEQDSLSDNVADASASVFVKHRPDVDLSSNVGQIKALVVNGIENLPYDQVTVALFEADQSAWPAQPDKSSVPNDNQRLEYKLGLVPGMKPGLLTAVIAAFVLLFGGAVVAGLMWHKRVLRRQLSRMPGNTALD